MSTSRLLFSYVLRPLPDPWAIRLWQYELGTRLKLRGRVIVSPQGLQAILGGDRDQLENYAAAIRQHPALVDVPVRWGEGQGEELPALRVSVQDQVAGFGVAAELEVAEGGVVGRTSRLTPTQVHELVAARGGEVVFFDGRNQHEAEVGRFRGAVVPVANAAREVLRELDSGTFDGLKARPVVTYCTGGLRSEVLASLMGNRGFAEVYQLDGGIVSYGTTFAGRGLWEGAVYVLGDRVQVVFSDHTTAIGHCEGCGAPTYSYRDCVAPLCADHALLCNGCADFALCAAHRN